MRQLRKKTYTEKYSCFLYENRHGTASRYLLQSSKDKGVYMKKGKMDS